MLIEHDGYVPRVDATARIAPTAVLCGDVTVGAHASVGFGAVLTAESGPVTIGDHCVVMENAVIRGTRQFPVSIGDFVLIGPHASLTGCTIADCVFLATGCAVFNGARIDPRCEVRINGIVHVKTHLDAETTVPIGWIAVGNPARLFPPDRHTEIWEVQKPLDFPQTVFGVERADPGESEMCDITVRYTRLLRKHDGDRVVE